MKFLIPTLCLLAAGCSTPVPGMSGSFTDPQTGQTVTVTVAPPPASQPSTGVAK